MPEARFPRTTFDGNSSRCIRIDADKGHDYYRSLAAPILGQAEGDPLELGVGEAQEVRRFFGVYIASSSRTKKGPERHEKRGVGVGHKSRGSFGAEPTNPLFSGKGREDAYNRTWDQHKPDEKGLPEKFVLSTQGQKSAVFVLRYGDAANMHSLVFWTLLGNNATFREANLAKGLLVGMHPSKQS